MRDPPIAAWLDAILAELRIRVAAEGWSSPGPLRTLYVGGGTPSLMGVGGMAGLAERLRVFLTWDGTAEWTAEANPETFTRELAEDWIRTGVNRLSLGAQTFNEAALRWMGRMHGPDGPGRAVAAARAAGFQNLNVDLIFGLPGRLERNWREDLERAIGLEPEHVSLYGLTAESATPLGRWVREGREVLASDDTYEAEYLAAAERLVEAGFVHYEVSNFARPGFESRHNRAYWDGSAYLGLGPGAHSYLPPRRFWNVRDWAEYRARLAEGRSVEEDREEVGQEERALERTWLGLRTTAGLPDLSIRQTMLARSWESAGWAELTHGRVRLTPRGWLLLDRLAVELDALA
jgi:oxygen-independent coproporphyrinogen-3 oxidase